MKELSGLLICRIYSTERKNYSTFNAESNKKGADRQMEKSLKDEMGKKTIEKKEELSEEKKLILKNRLILVTSKLIIIIIVIVLAILSQR